jgi:hypothetical protein
MLSLENKIVRWPGAKDGRPSQYHWKDAFLETWSCTIPGEEQEGWMSTSDADILLWCQCYPHEDRLDCFPIPFVRLKQWFQCYQHRFQERAVPNIIDGRALWTKGRLVPLEKICRRFEVEGFSVNAEGLIRDLWGEPILGWLK